MSTSAKLVLADGTIYLGTTYAATGSVYGELVFETTMTGYQHSLTNPSNANTIMVFTFPHIGNVGVNAADAESDTYWPNGVVIRDPARIRSNWQSEQSLEEVLEKVNVVGIAGVDTRALTRRIASLGQVNAAIFTGEQALDADVDLVAKVCNWQPSSTADLLEQVSSQTSYVVEAEDAKAKVALIDLGVRQATIDQLVARGNTVEVLPATTAASEVLDTQSNGVVFSSGPGNPAEAKAQVQLAKDLLDAKVPMLGIGLGHQVIATALGFTTARMPQAHRGPNHPVYDIASGHSLITNQNHEYAVNAKLGTQQSPNTDYGNVTVTQYSLNDKSVEALEANELPVITVQYYPEDSAITVNEPHPVFDRFATLMATGE